MFFSPARRTLVPGAPPDESHWRIEVRFCKPGGGIFPPAAAGAKTRGEPPSRKDEKCGLGSPLLPHSLAPWRLGGSLFVPKATFGLPSVTFGSTRSTFVVPNVTQFVTHAAFVEPKVTFVAIDATCFVPDVAFVAIDATRFVPDVAFVAIDATRSVPDVAFVTSKATFFVPDATFVVPDVTSVVPDATFVVPRAAFLAIQASPAPLAPSRGADARAVAVSAARLDVDADGVAACGLEDGLASAHHVEPHVAAHGTEATGAART